MNTHIILWSQFQDAFGSEGNVNGKLMFVIYKRGTKKIKYELQSYPFRNGIFTRANNTKKLFVHTDLEKVKQEADKYLKLMASFFVQPEPCDDATLVMFTMYHREANWKRGISISDIDTIQEIAAKFETKYKELRQGGKDWESSKMNWEETIVYFYNKNKPENWNGIL